MQGDKTGQVGMNRNRLEQIERDLAFNPDVLKKLNAKQLEIIRAGSKGTLVQKRAEAGICSDFPVALLTVFKELCRKLENALDEERKQTDYRAKTESYTAISLRLLEQEAFKRHPFSSSSEDQFENMCLFYVPVFRHYERLARGGMLDEQIEEIIEKEHFELKYDRISGELKEGQLNPNFLTLRKHIWLLIRQYGLFEQFLRGFIEYTQRTE